MKNLDKIINDEQLLDFALSHVCEKNSDEVHPVAERIVLLYIVNEFQSQGKEEFSDEEIQDRYTEMIASHVLAKLGREGLLDVDFDEQGETVYRLTQKGKDKVYGSKMS